MVRILVAGLGLIGPRHARLVESHPGLELAGVIEPRDSAAEAFPSVRRFSSIEEVDVEADGIVLATPTDLHEAGVKASLARGWSVLVEKPLSSTLPEARSITEMARRSDCVAMTGHHRRFHSRVVALKAMIEQGEIGRPLLANAIWAVRKPDSYFEAPWRRGIEGSVVRINLVHEVDLLRFCLGDAIEIQAQPCASVRGTERIESGAAILRFSGGACGCIGFSDASPSPWSFEAGTGENPNIPATAEDYLWIAGTEGGIGFPSLDLWRGASDWSERPERIRRDVPVNDPLAAQIEHFAEAIQGKEEPICSVEEGLKSLEATLAIEEAILSRSR